MVIFSSWKRAQCMPLSQLYWELRKLLSWELTSKISLPQSQRVSFNSAYYHEHSLKNSWGPNSEVVIQLQIPLKLCEGWRWEESQILCFDSGLSLMKKLHFDGYHVSGFVISSAFMLCGPSCCNCHLPHTQRNELKRMVFFTLLLK